MNPSYKFIPTISFIDGAMKVLTFKDHAGGGARMMIHVCHWKHHLPSDQPDQVLQVLTQIRTGRKGEAILFSIEWQMMEHNGSFGGLDT